MGENALVILVSIVHEGTMRDIDDQRDTKLYEHASWAEVVRRLCVHYYEEARQYFDQAKSDGEFVNHNEASPFFFRRRLWRSSRGTEANGRDRKGPD